MAKHNGRIISVDGFAGPGRYTGGEEGSPLIALRALLDHPHFRQRRPGREILLVFIEREEDRAVALREEISSFRTKWPIPNWAKVRVQQGEFAPLINQVLDTVEAEGHRLAPTFAFIDPFGFAGVPMELVSRIARNRRCECLITFMYEAINRFLAHPEPSIQGPLRSALWNCRMEGN